MYENQTYEIILERMLTNISNDIDKREGSIAYDMLAPKAAELAMSYMELDNVLNFGFADTTYGEFLDRKVSETGLTRIQSKKATGIITLSSTIEGLVIPIGSVVYTDNGIRFLTDNIATIFTGAATVSITAETGGLNGNVPAESIINSEITDVTCSNTNPTSGGFDIESDEKLVVRYYDTIKTPVTSGNTNHYKQWAKEISGIGDARIEPLWNGNGTVKVILVSTDKKSVLQSKIDEVSGYIELNRPIGATITVQSAVEKLINISATIVLAGAYTLGDVSGAINQGFVDYLKDASFKDIDIKYSKIGNIILSVQGVLDYSNLTVNTTTSNVLINNNETPVLGVVTLT